MAKLLPILLMLMGGAIGAGAGVFLKPEEQSPCTPEEECDKANTEDHVTTEESDEEPYYLAMKSQFVIPVIRDELVQSLVVLSLTLESKLEYSETIFARQPKIRDVFLQVLFDHSHIGGFNGSFTESSRMTALRIALLEAVQSIVGNIVTDVIITDIVRQET
ncbi:MAG: flagellar basal body-associated FliL family protein [Pseudomonadota bacterium]